MSEFQRPVGYKTMCFLGLAENCAIFIQSGVGFLFNFISSGFPLQRSGGSLSLDGEAFMLCILPVLGLAGIIVSFALLGRGRVVVRALYAYLLARWLVFLGILLAGADEYFRLNVGWDGHLAQPGLEDPMIMVIAILSGCLLHLPLFVASAYWYRPSVRTYASK